MTNQTQESGDGWVLGFDWKGDDTQTVRCLDCRMAVSFPSGMDRHGTHRIALPAQPAEAPSSEEGTDPIVGAPSIAIPAAVCSSCGETFSEAVRFCGLCGAPTEAPDTQAVVEGLQGQIASIQDELRSSQDEYAAFKQEASVALSALRTKSDRGQRKVTWQMIESKERWTFAWGVWWRIFAVVTVLYIILFALMLAAIQSGT